MAELSSTPFQAMNERRKRGEFCDFEIKVKGKKFPVHRVVLDSHSEYFHTMFDSNMLESKQGFCELENEDSDVVETCIEFMYMEKLDIVTADKAIKVLKLSHLWQLHKAVEMCEGILLVNLNPACCFMYWRLASLYNLKKLLSQCEELIFLNTFRIKYDTEIADLSLPEIKALLQKWKQHCNKRDIVSTIVELQRTKETNMVFWKLCCGWSSFPQNSSHFCQVVEQFQIEKLFVQDFIKIVTEENHITECYTCRKSVCQRFLNNIDGDEEISHENCLILKDLANHYNCESMKQRLTDYIVKNHIMVSKRPEFNDLVSPDDFIVYMGRLKCTEMSSDKFSIIASWIRFSLEREYVFPKLFKKMPLTKEQKRQTRWFSAVSIVTYAEVFKVEDVLFIKTLSRKYSCHRVEKVADEFIIKNFTRIAKQPDSILLSSKDLIFYLQKLQWYQSNEGCIWEFILKWVNHHPQQRKKEFTTIFHALNLEKFSLTFIRQTIRECELVKESTECTSHLLDFILSQVEELHKQVAETKKLEERISNLEKNLQKTS